jgi:cholinesterase
LIFIVIVLNSIQIHGGGVYTGNARTEMYGPDYLIEKDVVVVTFQYRIGVFGFLSLDDPSLNIPGNAQFRDHIFALQWIQRNIANFGGDPNNVTLFGESWGGGSTNYLMLTDKAKGLFHRGILMSGSALNPLYSQLPRRDFALRLCRKLGYNGPDNEKNILEFLENADEKEIVMASGGIATETESVDENLRFVFGPVVEPYDNGSAIITDKIIKMAENCWGNEIDIMIGATSNECSSTEMFAKVDSEFQKIIKFNRYIPMELEMPVNDPKRKSYAEMLQRNYYGLLKPTKTSFEGIIFLMNDSVLWHPMRRIIKSRNNSNKSGKTFVYRFDIDSENNLFKSFMKIDKYREPIHGDDVCYFFKSTMLGPNPEQSSPAFKYIELMVSILTQFAATGNPNVAELGVEWTPATFDEPLRGVNINEQKSEAMIFPESERMDQFDGMFTEQGKQLF